MILHLSQKTNKLGYYCALECTALVCAAHDFDNIHVRWIWFFVVSITKQTRKQYILSRSSKL